MMSPADLLYTLFIWPVRIIVEFIFVLSNRVFHDPGMAIVFLSMAVNTLLLPIYTTADKWQEEERELQRRMKKKLKDIRAVFRGDERQMLIMAYYRRMNYSPLKALKGSMGFLLQIPFFIAAYQLLSHTSSLTGESFLMLKALNLPDGLLEFPGVKINLMPVLMTAVNIASAFIYTRQAEPREKVQLFGIAGVFLVLLYNSPSGLVLYWLCNNIFSLGKNIVVSRLKNPGRALQAVVSLLAVLLVAGSLGGFLDLERYSLLFVVTGFCILLAPFAFKGLIAFFECRPVPERDAALLYFSSLFLLFLVSGALLPSQIMAESTSDFAGPLQFIFRTFVQAGAFFLLLGLLIWAFSPPKIRNAVAFIAGVLCLLGLVCLFVLSASYGIMNNSFKFDDPQLVMRAFPLWVNPVAIGAVLVACGLIVFFQKQKQLAFAFCAASAAVLVITLVNLVNLRGEMKIIAELRNSSPTEKPAEGVFPFTRSGNNTFVMFLDRALGAAMYPALEQMPEIKDQFDGFVWYPNTLSFGTCTLTGVPAMMGGYEYTPLEINKREDELLKDKVNEAVTMLPALFAEAGYRVSITDPSMTNFMLVPDISVFKDMKNVSAQNLDGRFDRQYMDAFPPAEEKFTGSFDFDIVFRYGLFRLALPALRFGLYYKGFWWRDGAFNNYGRGVTEFSGLYYLPEICTVDDGEDTLNIFMNEVTHESGAYTKELRPVSGHIEYTGEEKDLFGSEENASYMYTFMAAIKAVSAWLDYLNQAGVYDNTRIVIVSDHGCSFDGDILKSRMYSYNPLLMVKERGERGSLAVSEEFMTHADMPSIVTAGMEDPRNPWSLNPISMDAKNEGVAVVNEVSSQPRRHGPYLYNLSAVRTFRGKDIADPDSWDKPVPAALFEQEGRTGR